MTKMTIGNISEFYKDTDSAMNDCFCVFPDAFFSLCNETEKESWIDIFASYTDRTVVGRIIEN